jgi:hypothetical protein
MGVSGDVVRGKNGLIQLLYQAWIRIAADRVEGWIDLVRRKKICHQVAVKTGTARLGFDGKSRQGLRLEKTLTLALSQFGEYTKLGEGTGAKYCAFQR